MTHYADKYVTRPQDIPKCEHWVILEGRQLHIDGDERSRTNPGHGYPERTEYSMSCEVFMDEAKFREALADRSARVFGPSVRGIHVMGVYTSVITTKLEEAR